MTTWELATEADIQAIRVLIGKVKRLGSTPAIEEEELRGLTKRRAGVVVTQMREMLEEEGRERGSSRGAG